MRTTSAPPTATALTPSALSSAIRRHAVALSVLVAWAVILVGYAIMAWQPLSTDENDFFLAAADWWNWRQLIPHPHLYVHWMQLLFALFGVTVDAARLSVLIPNLATIALIPWLVRLISRDTPRETHWRAIAVLSVLLMALNPFVVQNSVLIDIDNSLLTTALVLLMCLWLALERSRAGLRLAVTAIGFAVCLWIKLPTPPMFIAALALYALLRRDWREAALATGAGILGVVLFAAAHSLYGLFTGYTLLDAVAAFLWRTGATGSIFSSIPNTFVQTAGVLVFWFSLPLMLLAGPVLFHSALRLVRNRLAKDDLLLIFSAIVFTFYSTMIVPAWGYPRYHTPGLPFLVVLISAGVVARLRATSRSFWVTLAGLMLATAVYALVVVGDPLYDIYRATFETTVLADRLRIGGLAVARLLPPLALALGLAVFAARRLGQSRRALLAATLVAVVFGFYAATNAVQASARYSTRYRYTYVYADRAQATALAHDSTPPSGYSLTDKDILWYAQVPGELVYPYLNREALLGVLRERRVDVLAWTDKEWMKAPSVSADPDVLQILDRCYQRQTFGVFTILVRKSGPDCADLP